MQFKLSTLVTGIAAAMTAVSLSAAPKTVDVLVLYTDAATQTSNGSDMDARIASYIEYTNQAYENSNVDIQLRLVGVENFDGGLEDVTSENLSALRSNSQVAAWRQEYGADLVTLVNLRKPMSGGYVCGIGYVPSGSESTGQLYSNAASVGFSLVGVDCGYNTFSHELGHNMSLGHSYEQGSKGGVWDWARGHGVRGSFSTVMAYPHAFGTYNQLQQFSNPAQTNCEGQACGVDGSQMDGADSATNLNALAAQVANFVPTVVVDNGGNGDAPLCEKPELEGNLLQNGDFNALEGWTRFANIGALQQQEVVVDCGRDYQLVVTDRTQSYAGAYQDVSAVVSKDVEYRLTGKVGLQNTSLRQDVRVAIQITDDSGVHYQYLEPVSVTENSLTPIDQSFTLEVDGTLRSAGILVYGPATGIDMVMDEIKLVETGVVSEPAPLYSEGFESGATGWGGYFNANLSISGFAKDGNYSLLTNNRAAWYSGPGLEVRGVVNPGEQYSFSADIYLQSSSRTSDSVQLWAYWVDADNRGKWERLTSQTLPTAQWASMSGNFTLNTNGPVTQLSLHVFGPQPTTSYYLDNVVIDQ